MPRRIPIALFTTAVLGLAGCGNDDDGTAAPSTTAATTATPPSTVAPTEGTGNAASGVLFEEAFEDDRNGWGVIDDPDYGTTSYTAGDYVWQFTGSVGHLLPEVLAAQYDAGQLDMVDVIVRADATIASGDGVIGVFCREVPDTDAEWQWYEFVARDGYAAIRHADLEGNLDVLAETDEITLPLGEPIAFQASCVDTANGAAELTLELNGSTVLTFTDETPLGNGVPGIQAWTFPVHEPIEVHWHEFAIRRPDS